MSKIAETMRGAVSFPRLALFKLGCVLLALPPAQFASGQSVVLYRETFPFGGLGGSAALFPVSSVGWANDIQGNPFRIYDNSGGDGAVYAFQNSAWTSAFYTSTVLSSNTGATFPSINITNYAGLTFAVDIEPYLTPANVSARFCVRINGDHWFVSTNVLPVPAVTSGFATYTMAFNTGASQWDALTVSDNGTASGATIGAPVTHDLGGVINGAGLVFVHTGNGGTFNFDNFTVTAANVGTLTANSVSNGTISLSWPGALNVCLQATTNLAAMAWSNDYSAGGQSSAAKLVGRAPVYWRLASFPLGALQDGDFESGNLLLDWQNSGNASAAFLASGNAYSGGYSLWQSNSSPYAVETSQLATNLPNGYYKLTAMVKNSGGQSWCYLGGNDRLSSLPVSSQWTNIVVRGINVTNGQCLVAVSSDDTNGGDWCAVDLVQLIKDDIPYTFYRGGDISELTYVEEGGGVYYETNGAAMNCLQILKNHGCNIVRFRLYNDPGNPNYSPSNLLPPGIQSPTNILDLARQATAMGLQTELTFYYSDYWSETLPHAWANLTFSQLTNAVYNFTTNFMAEMQNQGTTPQYVSLGDEINSTGLLVPQGSITNWPQLSQILITGYNAVKAVSPSTKVILHLNSPDPGSVTWFFNNCVSYGVPWDISGCSFYPYWDGITAEQARDEINTWYTNYNKPVFVMETGYNWSSNLCDGYTGQLANDGPEPFPSTPAGQKEFMLNCFNALKLVNSGQCLGDLYWDPIFICVPGEGWELGQPNVVDNTTLFNFDGRALPALDAFDYNN